MKNYLKEVLKMIVILVLLSVALTAISGALEAQDKVSLSIHQDLRLAVAGDERGNPAGTLDVLIRFKMQGKAQKYGYMVVYPEYEHASIDGNYRRYSANVGYTFENLIVRDFEASAYGGWGWIDRYAKSYFSGSVVGELAYRVTDNFKFSALAQLTDRTDLSVYGDGRVVRFSGFVGVDINLN